MAQRGKFRVYAFLIVFAVSAARGSREGFSQNLETIRLTFEFAPKDLEVRYQQLPGQLRIAHVRLRGAEVERTPGFPELPYLARTVVLPPGALLKDVAATEGKEISIPGVGLVAWAQPPQAGREPVPPQLPPGGPYSHTRAEPIDMDPALDQYPVWPPKLAKIAGEEVTASGYRLVTLKVYPVRWNRAQGSLGLLSSLSADIVHSGGSLKPPREDYPTAMELEYITAVAANAQAVPRIPIPPTPEELDAEYLIITDNYNWSANRTRETMLLGDIVREFRRLAQWKTERGVKAEVVTISDIVGGRYGDFVTGALDLQETIRNFLKHARRSWHTYWVLLGGDVGILPPREAVAFVWHGSHFFKLRTAAFPIASGTCYWWAEGEKVRLCHDGHVNPDDLLVSRRTGRAFARRPNPSSSDPGWTYMGDATYLKSVDWKTNYIVIAGPRADLELTDVYAVHYANTIPTDLYYASLAHPDYGLPGVHDWDRNGNGLYSQYDAWREDPGEWAIDGAHYHADLAVGRASISGPSDARNFVDKVIAYESYAGVPPEFGRTLLLGSGNWGGYLVATEGETDPPEKGKYFAAAGGTVAKIYWPDVPSNDISWQLVAWWTPGNYVVFPYNESPSALSPGFYFCPNPEYAHISRGTRTEGGVTYTVPYPWWWTRAEGPALDMHPRKFFLDSAEPDLSLLEKDEVYRLFGERFPQVDMRRRRYEDIWDAPDFGAPGLSDLSPEGMRTEFERGYNLVSLTGHGNYGGCAFVDVSWVRELTNGYRGGVAYADSCLTNEFNVTDAVSEVFTTTETGGMAAYVGSSRFSWVGHGAALERTFWSALETTRHLGLLHDTKALHADSDTHLWTNYALNLIGDPEMEIWLGTPREIAVTHPARVAVGQSFVLRVAYPDASPVSGARVCVSGPKGIIERRYTPPSGELHLSTTGARAGDQLVVTVRKRDHIPYRGTIDITVGMTRFVRGDANSDDKLDISDGISILNYLFLGQGSIDCEDAADVNDDGTIDISDAIKVLGFLFLGDKLPPGTTPGEPQEDPTPDNLRC